MEKVLRRLLALILCTVLCINTMSSITYAMQENEEDSQEVTISEENKEDSVNEKENEYETQTNDQIQEIEENKTTETNLVSEIIEQEEQEQQEQQIEQSLSFIENENVVFSGGEGTKQNPYVITNAEQLNAIRNNLSAYYVLKNNIDLAGYNWIPIGNEDECFTGKLNGCGYYISNLSIARDRKNNGLFGMTDTGAGIYNLGIINCNINASISNAGGIAGTISKTEIVNCYVNGNISSSNIGGIVGSAWNSKIQYCYNKAALSRYAPSNANLVAGGIVGYCEGTEISSCYNLGNIQGSESIADRRFCYWYIGGIIGDSENGKNIINNCYNLGNIDVYTMAAFIYGGGLIGRIKNSCSIEECYNFGNVNLEAMDKDLVLLCATNLVYSETSELEMKNCYYSSLCWPSSGAVAGKKSSMVEYEELDGSKLNQESSYKGFDFENVWVMGKDSPELRIYSWEEDKEPEDEKPVTNVSVKFFSRWDAEKQIAYWGQGDYVGSQVTEETDTSFLEKLDDLIGCYVLVETKSKQDNILTSDILVSIKCVETKFGVVTEINGDTITIGNERYSIPNNLISPSSYVNEVVLYHIYEDKLKQVEILKKQEGMLIYWNSETCEVKIDNIYHISSIANSETMLLLGDTGTKRIKVRYYYDQNGFIYEIEKLNEEISEVNKKYSIERDGWGIVNTNKAFGWNNHRISKETYIKTFGITFSDFIFSTINSIAPIDGVCYGLSVSSIANYLEQINLKTYFDSDEEALVDYGYESIKVDSDGKEYFSIEGNEEVIKLIERCHISQDSEEFKKIEVFKGDSKYTNLLDYLNSKNAKPLLVTLSDFPSVGGHTVVIDPSKKINQIEDSEWYQVFLYDPNAPACSKKLQNPNEIQSQEQSYFLLNTENGKWKYVRNGKTRMEASYYEWGQYLQLKFTSYSIRFYDLTQLDDSCWNSNLTLWPDDKITLKFKAHNYSLYDSDGNTLFEVNNDRIIKFSEECEFNSLYEGEDKTIMSGTVTFPMQTFEYSSDKAEVIILSDAVLAGISNLGQASIKVKPEIKEINASSNQKANICVDYQNGTSEYTAIELDTDLDESDIKINAESPEKTIISSSDPNTKVNIAIEDSKFGVTEVKNMKVGELDYINLLTNKVVKIENEKEIKENDEKNLNNNDEKNLKNNNSEEQKTINSAQNKKASDNAVILKKNNLEKQESKTIVSPSTGDKNHIIIWEMIFIIDIIIFIVIFLRIKKRS